MNVDAEGVMSTRFNIMFNDNAHWARNFTYMISRLLRLILCLVQFPFKHALLLGLINLPDMVARQTFSLAFLFAKLVKDLDLVLITCAIG